MWQKVPGESNVTEKDILPGRRKLFRLSVFDDRRFALTFYRLDSATWDEALERVRQLPERKWSRDLQCWLIPFSAANVEHIRTNFHPEEYDLDEESSVVLRYATTREEIAEKKERRRWEYIFNDVVPPVNFSPYRQPYKHQIVALDALHNSTFFALLMEMGTGKTKVIVDESVWQAQLRLSRGEKPFKVLIVCPRTIQRTWLQEINKDTPPDLPYWAGKMETSIRGMQTLLDMATARVPLKYVITNYEKLGSMGKALKAIKFDMMVLDESTKIKTPSTHRTKNAIEIGETASRRAILTGAPVTNNILDLFSQFQFLEDGILGYSNYHQFKTHFARIAKLAGRRIEKITGYRNLNELKERVARYSFIVRKDQCLDLPPKNFETRYVEMSEKQAELYMQMLETFIATLTNYTDPSGTMKAQVIIVQLLRLAQICCGYMKTASGEERPIPGENPKIEALLDIIEQLSPDAKLLVWARFHHDIKTITQVLTNRHIGWVKLTGGMSDRERDQSVELFNGRNQVRVLVGEPGTGGYGLTLLGHPENPCYTVVYYSNDFSLEKRIQSEDRVHRIGQVRPVTYIDIVCEGTVEERIAVALQKKRDLSETIKDISSIKTLLLGERDIPDAVLQNEQEGDMPDEQD
jgi:SNF2 family DNA or RNA helicase